MIISGTGGGVMQAVDQAHGENKRFNAIAKYFDYSSTGSLKFGHPKPKIALNW